MFTNVALVLSHDNTLTRVDVFLALAISSRSCVISNREVEQSSCKIIVGFSKGGEGGGGGRAMTRLSARREISQSFSLMFVTMIRRRCFSTSAFPREINGGQCVTRYGRSELIVASGNDLSHALRYSANWNRNCCPSGSREHHASSYVKSTRKGRPTRI